MASPDGRDRDPTTTTPPKSENPFIKFRQFADSHISSLLQGIVGLPSAFSNTTSENSRWAGFDEDLRRRDEVKARQQQLRDAEGQRKVRSTGEGSNIAVRKSPDWEAQKSQQPEAEVNLPVKKSRDWDIPLYSPLENNTLDKSAHPLHPSSSVLDYLLFSPYSPLKLEDSYSRLNSRAMSAKPFPYRQAFEELLASTIHGEPSSNNDLYHLRKPNPNPLDETLFNMRYIDNLEKRGLLHRWDASFPSRYPYTRLDDSKNESDSTRSSTAAATELEMYDTFLKIASLPTATSSTFASLFKEIDDVITALDRRADLDWIQQGSPREESKSDSRASKESIQKLDEVWKSLGKAFQEEKIKSDTSKAAHIQPPDRVLTTRTVTEHFTSEDGVETTVTVERTFADGRETVTTTSHFEEKPLLWDETAKRERQVTKREDSEQASEEKQKTEKKGWFWN